MKVIIAGSRTIADRAALDAALTRAKQQNIAVTEVVCGGATGADHLGDEWARDAGLPVQYLLVDPFRAYHRLCNLELAPGVFHRADEPARFTNVTIAASWDADGKGAGPKRNRAMAAYAEALIALWDGRSPGTEGMILAAHRRGLPVQVQIVGRVR